MTKCIIKKIVLGRLNTELEKLKDKESFEEFRTKFKLWLSNLRHILLFLDGIDAKTADYNLSSDEVDQLIEETKELFDKITW